MLDVNLDNLTIDQLADFLGELVSLEARVRLRLTAAPTDNAHIGLMLPEAVAELLGVKIHFVYERARRGELKCVRLGSHVRFTLADVEAFIEEKR